MSIEIKLPRDFKLPWGKAVPINAVREEIPMDYCDTHETVTSVVHVLIRIGQAILILIGLAVGIAIGILSGAVAFLTGCVGLYVWHDETTPYKPKYKDLYWSLAGIIGGPILILLWYLWWWSATGTALWNWMG